MKSTKTTVTQRIDEILRIRLDGAAFHDVVQYAAEKGWELKERQLRNLIRRADELLVERRVKSRKRMKAMHLARRESLYARAVNAADYRTALAILSDLARIEELYVTSQDMRELKTIHADLMHLASARVSAERNRTDPEPIAQNELR